MSDKAYVDIFRDPFSNFVFANGERRTIFFVLVIDPVFQLQIRNTFDSILRCQYVISC